jgi:ferredoxin
MKKEEPARLQNDKAKLRKLTALMNKQNKRPFPPLDPTFKLIDCVLAGDELDLLLRLGTDAYSREQALAASSMSGDRFDALFEALQQKGFVGTRYEGTGEESYTLNPFLVGWFEAQVPYLIGKPGEKEFARRWIDLMSSGRSYNFFPFRNLLNMMGKAGRVSNQSVGPVRSHKDEKGRSIINIGETVNAPDSKIYPTKPVNDLIQEYGSGSVIGQFPCMCRRIMSNLDAPCRLNIPDDGGCLGFGDMVRPYIKYGHARQISKEEALEVIQKVRDRGAIHSVFHEKDDTNQPQVGICNCCWDCCGLLRTYNVGSTPLRYSSFYLARIVDSTKCTGCKKCEKYCPTAAITVTDKKPSIDARKCIGCGQCVHQCFASAVELVENVRTAFLPMLKKSEARIAI